MPLYPVHIAADRHEPLPPIADLTTIEANSPEDALAKLRQEPFIDDGGTGRQRLAQGGREPVGER
jgi:hypothetical protein